MKNRLVKLTAACAAIVAAVGIVSGAYANWSDSLSAPIPAQATSSSLYEWDETKAPNYVFVDGKSSFDKIPAKGEVLYSDLDNLGRTRKVWANVTYAMTQAGREDFPKGCEPSGWNKNSIVTIELYNGKTYNGYMWNRSHLVADSLGGDPNRHNLITGTRMQNVGANDGKGGMAYSETKARNWLYKHTSGTVLYSAEPNYMGDELVPRSVTVNYRTSDNSIDERVIVYNACKGYMINYSNGTFTKGALPNVKSNTLAKPVKLAKPAKPKISKIKRSSRAVAIASSKVKASGYHFAISTTKRFAKGKTKSKYSTANKITFAKLAKRKKYYVRVRAYNKSAKQKVYGSWSAVKQTKTR